jgi:hypothetical protein
LFHFCSFFIPRVTLQRFCTICQGAFSQGGGIYFLKSANHSEIKKKPLKTQRTQRFLRRKSRYFRFSLRSPRPSAVKLFAFFHREQEFLVKESKCRRPDEHHELFV